jgi:hypothetical protein
MKLLCGLLFSMIIKSKGSVVPSKPTFYPTSRPTDVCTDPLPCYLSKIEIDIPSFCETINGLNLCLKNFACEGILLNDINSSYVPPTTLRTGIYGIGTYCSGQYSAGPLLGGTLIAAVNETDVDIDILVKEENELPVALNFTSCDITSINVFVKFSSTGLDSISSELEQLIARAFYVIICDKLNNFLVTNVTDALVNNLDPLLVELINQQPSSIKTYGKDFMNWGNSFISTIHDLTNRLKNISIVGGVSDNTFIKCMTSQVDLDSYRYLLSIFTNQMTITDLFETYIDLESKNITIPLGSNSSLKILSASFSGFNSINNIEIFEPVDFSNVTLRTGLQFDFIEIELGMEFIITASFDNNSIPTEKYVYAEKLNAKLLVKDIALILDLVLAVDSYVLSKFYLDQMMNGRSCLLYAINEVSIPNLFANLNVSEISVTQGEGSAGLLENGIIELVNNALLIVTSGYNNLVTDLIAGILQGPVRNDLNKAIQDSIATTKKNEPCLTHYPYHSGGNFLYWPNNSFIKIIDSIVNEKLGSAGLNKIIKCATGGSGAIDIVSNNKFKVEISGLDSFYDFFLLDVNKKKPYDLLNSIGIGSCPNDYLTNANETCNPLKVSIISLSNQKNEKTVLTGSVNNNNLRSVSNDLNENVEVDLISGFSGSIEPKFFNEETDVLSRSMTSSSAMPSFDISISIANLKVYLDLLLKLDLNAVYDLQIDQVNTLGCFASTIEAMSIQSFNVTFSEADLKVNNDAIFRNITSGLTRLLNRIVNNQKIIKKNAEISQKLSKSSEVCKSGGVVPHSTDDLVANTSSSTSSYAWEWELSLLVAGCVSALFGLLWAYNYWGKESKKIKRVMSGMLNNALVMSKYKSNNNNNNSNNINNELQVVDERTFFERWDLSNSLIFHPEVPKWLRIVLPLCVLVDIGVFVASNYSPDAVSVMVKLIIGSKTIDVGSVFDFGLANTVSDMWEAKVYTLSIIIAFFSGAWPYVKLLFMLSAWLLPPTVLSIDRREFILKMLDALGKWSLIDFFVMVLFLCAFHFQINIRSFIIVDVTVLPKWGFYTFLLATMISLGLGHILLACHRLIVDRKIPEVPIEFSTTESIATFKYIIDLQFEEASSSSKDDVREKKDVDGYHLLNNKDDNNDVKKQVSFSSNFIIDDEQDFKNPIENIESNEEKDASITKATNNDNILAPNDVMVYIATNKKHKKILVQFTKLGISIVIITILATFIFLIAGTFLQTILFSFEGLVGVLLKDKSKVSYSFVTVGTSIPNDSGEPNNFGVRWLQASFFMFGQAMPIALLLALLILWIVPLSINFQRQLFVLTEVLNAWSALDVFCVAIAAAIFQIQQFAAFIVGDKCDGINKLIAMIDSNGVLNEDICFDVIASLKQVFFFI